MKHKFKPGSRVEHINHGKGTLLCTKLDEALVEFDIKPDGWDKTLCVSVACLKPVKED